MSSFAYPFALERSLLPQNQFAAFGGTGIALSRLFDYIDSDATSPTYAIFFDVEKAFDRVHIATSLRMLDEMDVPYYLIRWLWSYLHGRETFVGKVAFDIANDVPQGSVLGPLLFQLYTSERLVDFAMSTRPPTQTTL